MRYRIVSFYHNVLKKSFFKNSFWGVFSNIIQNIFYSIFFIVVARKYNISDFSDYILANTLYGFVLSFSSLGLGQWFIRELLQNDNKEYLISKFFKFQLRIGLIFYLINIVLVYSIYKSPILRQISLVIGLNVIFDNIIYVIKYINIVESTQKKTFIILIIESILKFLVGISLLYIQISILNLVFILIILRFITLNLFLKIGTTLSFKIFIKTKLNFLIIKDIVLNNWPFIIIGSISVVYWRIGNILISKFLTPTDVAYYEIAFKLFSIAEIIPVIVSTSIFPIFINIYKENPVKTVELYKIAFLFYAIYGIIVYTFVLSFSDYFVPFLFGIKFSYATLYCKQMFLTILIFPTVLLQANLLITMKMEKIDMWLNVICLFSNILFSIIGMYLFKSLSVINYSIFFSFILFHILQDVILCKKKILNITTIFGFYITLTTIVVIYYFLSFIAINYLLFFTFWSILGGILFYSRKLFFYKSYFPS